MTRGTDPHIFLVRALAGAGLTEHDVKLVLLQHPDGRTALERGDVAAWAGLDPMMAAAEIESGARLFYRNAAANTWGVLNVREAFAAENPDLVRRVLATYERARRWSVEHPAELKALMMAAMKLPDAVVARQLERNDLSSGAIGEKQAQTIIEAGKALQQAGVLPADVDVMAVTGKLIDPSFARAAGHDDGAAAAPLLEGVGEGAPRCRARPPPLLPQRGELPRLLQPGGCGADHTGGLGIAWELAVRTGIAPGRLMPPPSRLFHTAAALAASGELQTHVAATMTRVAIGFGIGAAAGTLLGMLTGASDTGASTAGPVHPGAARHPLDRLGADLHPLARHLRDLEAGADRARRVLPGLSRHALGDPERGPQADGGRPRVRLLASRHHAAHHLARRAADLDRVAAQRPRSRLHVRRRRRTDGRIGRSRLPAARRPADGPRQFHPGGDDRVRAARQASDGVLVALSAPLLRWQDTVRSRL